MRDRPYGDSPLIDVTTVPLRSLAEVDSAALRAAVASCLHDDMEQVAAFSNTI